jgi:hypothetical protein
VCWYLCRKRKTEHSFTTQLWIWDKESCSWHGRGQMLSPAGECHGRLTICCTLWLSPIQNSRNQSKTKQRVPRDPLCSWDPRSTPGLRLGKSLWTQ